MAGAMTAPNYLPLQLTSFIGRECEIAEVERLLGTTRLLTLTGAGGCGKTRLALKAAGEVLGAYPDGAWLVELALLADPALVAPAVAPPSAFGRWRARLFQVPGGPTLDDRAGHGDQAPWWEHCYARVDPS
jgi:hypothetical protein